MLLTHPPLVPQTSARRLLSASRARLACIRHAASVRPEPRSNSPKIISDKQNFFALKRSVLKSQAKHWVLKGVKT